uniref:Enoyl CoA hydratase 1, peroxisomal n=1 Tax=Acanthochromis polyacanthus TaxID=80966 RepID=A0A3Q1GQY7_9TELE
MKVMFSPVLGIVVLLSFSPGPVRSSLAISRPAESITHVELHRPEKRNSMNKAFWRQELQVLFSDIDPICHDSICFPVCVVLCCVAGVDLITACDIRLCTQDAWFQVKEVDIGMAADVGTLQRLPKVVGSRSLVNELALTARKMYADEAKSSGLHRVDLLQAVWNMSMLQSQDVMKSAMAAMEKKSPKEVVFSKL